MASSSIIRPNYAGSPRAGIPKPEPFRRTTTDCDSVISRSVLSDISLKIIATKGPSTLAGDAAADIVTRPVNKILSPSVFRPNPPDIPIPVRMAATNANDAFFVDFCPILSRAGTAGTIWVTPTFRAVDGSVISDLVVTAGGKDIPEEGLRISLAHPKYINVDFDEARTEIIKR